MSVHFYQLEKRQASVSVGRFAFGGRTMFRSRATAIAFALTIGLQLSVSTHAVEIETKHHTSAVEILIRGEITGGDATKLQKHLDELDFENMNLAILTLLSPGGDAIEAMAMGRLVRQRFIPTVAPSFSMDNCAPGSVQEPDLCVCLSACMLVWVGGIQRTGGLQLFAGSDPAGQPTVIERSSLGIHRPRFDAEYFAGLSAKQAELRYQELLGTVKAYLDEMDVPAWVYDKMISVPSERIEFLSNEELKRIGSPPATSEWITSKCEPLATAEREDLLDLAVKNARGELSRIEQRAYDSLMEKSDAWGRCQREVIRKEQRSRQPGKKFSFR